jgi:hypothetical protein
MSDYTAAPESLSAVTNFSDTIGEFQVNIDPMECDEFICTSCQ